MDESPRVLIIRSPYYEEIASELLAGATAALDKAGAAFDTVSVPGALEIPAALAMAVEGGKYDAYVLLGCVIRGETSHYDVVVNESARGTMELVTRHGLALGFAVLTVENRDQAMRRARVAELNKGGEAAEVALAMIGVRDTLRSS